MLILLFTRGMYKYIQLQFENIEKKFQDFEDAMEDNAYDEVVHLVKVLDEMIAHIGVSNRRNA